MFYTFNGFATRSPGSFRLAGCPEGKKKNQTESKRMKSNRKYEAKGQWNGINERKETWCTWAKMNETHWNCWMVLSSNYSNMCKCWVRVTSFSKLKLPVTQSTNVKRGVASTMCAGSRNLNMPCVAAATCHIQNHTTAFRTYGSHPPA